MKYNFFIFLLAVSVLLNTKVNAQADCYFRYCYVGQITANGNTNNIHLQLPSVELMKKIVKKSKGFINVQLTDSSKFKKELVTIGSSFFCGTSENIIEKVLRANKKYYTIYVVKNKKKYKRRIDIRSILFKSENGVIYINLPVINI